MTAILARIRAGEHVDHFETTRVRTDGTVYLFVLEADSLSILRTCSGSGA